MTVVGGYVVGQDNVYRNVLAGNYVDGDGVCRTHSREKKSMCEK